MVQLDLFENSYKNQALRTLTALAIIVIADLVYLGISQGSLQRFKDHKMAYFNVWITLAVVFGVSILTSDNYDINVVNTDTIKNYVEYGILIGLLIYVPLYNWLISCGKYTNIGVTQLSGLANVTFGIILSSFTCLCVFLISEKTNLISD
jgi:Na+/proline symporter